MLNSSAGQEGSQNKDMLIPVILLTSFILVIISFLYIVYKPPKWLIAHLQYRWPDVLFHVPTKQKVIALTIDDGPSDCTEEIRDILEQYGAKATFFLIGSHIVRHEETTTSLLRQLVLHGHELANHAMHDEPSRSLTEAELKRQIQYVDAQLEEIYQSAAATGQENGSESVTGTGPAATSQKNRSGSVPGPTPKYTPETEIRPVQRPRRPPPNHPSTTTSRPLYFRPGSGFFSIPMRKTIAALHHRLVLGSIYPHDAQIPFWRVNARHILSILRPGAIVVCHDRKWTPAMLRAVLPEVTRRGYRVVTVTDLLNFNERG